MVFKTNYCLMQVKIIAAICNIFTFIKLLFVIKIIVLFILSGRFTQVFLYTVSDKTYYSVTSVSVFIVVLLLMIMIVFGDISHINMLKSFKA